MTNSTIKRDVGDKSKGFRLQKLRAIKLILDEIQKNEKVFVYASTEFYEDVFLKTVTTEKVKQHLESDKNYSSERAFSYMSDEIKNSMVSFIDCWLNEKRDRSLVFCFYTNIRIAREHNTEYTKKLGITLPDKPILELLMEKKLDYLNLLPTLKKVLIDEYMTQYDGKKEVGHIESINKLDDKDWLEFFGKIDWNFKQEDDVELENLLIEEIKNSKLYSLKIEGKEKYILGALIAEFERKENLPDTVARLVSASDVKLIFLEIANEVHKRNDPVYEIWQDIENPSDKRNLEEKITAVSENYNKRKLGLLNRRVGTVKIELKRVDSRDSGSYLYRILESCEPKLLELISNYDEEQITPEILDTWINELVSCAEAHLEVMSEDYSYPFKNKNTLANAVLELFDSCFLAFD